MLKIFKMQDNYKTTRGAEELAQHLRVLVERGPGFGSQFLTPVLGHPMSSDL